MSGTPAYVQVADDLRTKIREGALGVGEQLPSLSQLREMYSVSGTVIRDALNELRREGLVVGQQGKGNFVRATDDENAPGSEPLDQIMSRLDDLAAAVRLLDARIAQLEQDVDRGT